MSLREKITEQFNSALKSKNKNLVSTLRLVLAAIKDKDIANRTGEKKEIMQQKGYQEDGWRDREFTLA